MIEILEKTKFDAVKEIADMTIQISGAKLALEEIKNAKNEFISEREKETVEKIQKIINDSKEILEQANKNYAEVHNLLNILTSYKECLDELNEKFAEMIGDFNKKDKEWKENTEKQYKEIEELQRQTKEDAEKVKREKDDIKKAHLQIKKDYQRIASRQAQIKSALEVINNK